MAVLAEDCTGMPPWDTIAIIGVGLIGGSVGLAVRGRQLARHVVGCGRSPENLELARERGAIDSASATIAAAVEQANLVVICTPVEQIVGHALAAAEHCPPGALITDAGSTKAAIVQELAAKLDGRPASFVGAHPLAGGEKQGAGAADARLFENKLVVVTPAPASRPGDVQAVERFWSLLGARVERMTPEAHDHAVASISHLPHLLAAALAAATPQEHLPLAAAGWSDTTRIASGDAELWTQILRQNRRNVLSALSGVERCLEEFRAALENEDYELLTRLLKAGKNARDAVGS